MKKIFGLSVVCSAMIFDFPVYGVGRILKEVDVSMPAKRLPLVSASAGGDAVKRSRSSSEVAEDGNKKLWNDVTGIGSDSKKGASSTVGSGGGESKLSTLGKARKSVFGASTAAIKEDRERAGTNTSLANVGGRRFGSNVRDALPAKKMAKVEVKSDVSAEIMKLLAEQDRLVVQQKELIEQRDDARESVIRFQSEIEELKKSLTQITEQHDQEMKEAYHKARDDESEMRSYFETRLSEAESRVCSLERQKKELEERVAGGREKSESTDFLKKIADMEEHVQLLQKQKEEVEEKLEEAISTQAQYGAILAESEIIKSESEQLKEQLEKALSTQAQYGAILAESEAVKEEYEGLKGQLESIQKELDNKCDDFSRIFEFVNRPKDDGTSENIKDTEGLLQWIERVNGLLKNDASALSVLLEKQSVCKKILLEVFSICKERGLCEFNRAEYEELDLEPLVDRFKLFLGKIVYGKGGIQVSADQFACGTVSLSESQLETAPTGEKGNQFDGKSDSSAKTLLNVVSEEEKIDQHDGVFQRTRSHGVMDASTAVHATPNKSDAAFSKINATPGGKKGKGKSGSRKSEV